MLRQWLAADQLPDGMQEASADFANGLESLAHDQLVLLGGSGGGSRAVQAFLEGPATSKAKRRLIKKLASGFGTLALTPGGSFLTESCFGAAVCLGFGWLWDVRAVVLG